MTRRKEDVELALRVTRAEANWGVGEPMTYRRNVLVEPDGEVLAYDDGAGHYSRWHDLTDAQLAEARRLAALVWDGTHYVAAGQLFPVKRA